MKVIEKIRCPLCGDSITRPNSKRGYVLEHNGHKMYRCHNEIPSNYCPAHDGIPYDKFLQLQKER